MVRDGIIDHEVVVRDLSQESFLIIIISSIIRLSDMH
jgi:hypothetical protein